MWVLNYKHFYENLGKKDLEILPKFTKFPNFRGVLKKVLLFGVEPCGERYGFLVRIYNITIHPCLRGELRGAEMDQTLLSAHDINLLVVRFEGESSPACWRENIPSFSSRNLFQSLSHPRVFPAVFC